jgi:hypothetical protein
MERVRCPTCRADQDWSDTCRRCKSDLRLLRAFAATYQQSRTACLKHVRGGHGPLALRAARRCFELYPDSESRRLLAMAALACGNWETATALAHTIHE